MRRASFELFAKGLREQGYSDEKIRSVLETMIEKGLCEGNEEIGFILTEKGCEAVEEVWEEEKEKQVYGALGAR